MTEHQAVQAANGLPLCVDLDGTLIGTDLLYESLAALARSRPLLLLLVPFWLCGGRARLKRELSARVQVNAALLPYRKEVLTVLRAEHAEGRKLILVTASDAVAAKAVADYLGFFSEVAGSDGRINLKGSRKADYLIERFGKGNFEYAGDAHSDIPVWKASAGGSVVSSSAAFAERVRNQQPNIAHIALEPMTLKTVIKAIRVYQWVKNILIFLPILLAHKIFDSNELLRAAAAFTSFSLCASSVYVANDLLDLEADRQHSRKKHRPFASGKLPLQSAFLILPVFLFAAIALALNLPARFGFVLAGYFVMTTAYSLYFKQIVMVDIVLLAALYCVRLIAGGAAAMVPVSQWLLAFAMFFFFSLACVKRYSELLALRQRNELYSKGRGYRAADLEQIGVFGSASAYLSILVLALYVNSSEVAVLYGHAKYLWLLCPLLLYWVSRIWLFTHRGEMHDDPIIFALTDRVSYFVGLCTAAIVLLAI